MKKIAWVILLTFFTVALFSQTKNTSEDYIKLYYEIAVRKMHEYKIPASITLAQGILESGNGNSSLSKKANNHFGIKCHSDWTGKGYYMDDDAADECFRVYDSPEESFADHSKFLTTRSRYKFLFTDYKTDDYKSWAKGLKKAGYATNPNYANLLISIIERHELDQYDRMEYIPATTETITYVSGTEYEIIELPKNAYYSDKERGIFIYNRAETIKSHGKSLKDIAKEFDVSYEKLLKYNDLDPSVHLEPNQNVFLSPKRKKGAMKKHKVQEGESMWEISQMYGIKLSRLYKLNYMVKNDQPEAGELLYMRSKAPGAPKIMDYAAFLKKRRVSETPPPPKVEKVTTPAEIIKETPAPVEEIPIESPRVVSPVSITIPVEETPVVEPVEEEPVIEMPPVPVVETPVVTQPATPGYHVVKPEETLYSISNLYYVTVEELMEYNGLKNYSLELGQLLRLTPREKEVVPETTPEKKPVKEEVKEVVTETKPAQGVTTISGNTVKHTVVAGETLYALSRKYNVTVDQIKSWNNLTNNTLKVGQVLVVSQ